MAIHVNPVHEATCHCGEVRLRLTLPNGLEDLRRCDCSMCRRRGTIVASVSLSNLEVIQGQEIYTHHQRRSNPEQYGFNVACLEGVYPFDIENVPVLDGVNHPSDQV
jgi:hypothetical protein